MSKKGTISTPLQTEGKIQSQDYSQRKFLEKNGGKLSYLTSMIAWDSSDQSVKEN
jgi:hypothetical protein